MACKSRRTPRIVVTSPAASAAAACRPVSLRGTSTPASGGGAAPRRPDHSRPVHRTTPVDRLVGALRGARPPGKIDGVAVGDDSAEPDLRAADVGEQMLPDTWVGAGP
jgi:hypothetical protein